MSKHNETIWWKNAPVAPNTILLRLLNNNLPRRLSSSCLIQGRSLTSHPNSAAVVGRSDKLAEINTDPYSDNHVSWFCDRFFKGDFPPTRDESSKGSCSLQKSALSASNDCTSTSQPVRHFGVLLPCHLASPLTFQGSSDSPDTNNEGSSVPL